MLNYRFLIETVEGVEVAFLNNKEELEATLNRLWDSYLAYYQGYNTDPLPHNEVWEAYENFICDYVVTDENGDYVDWK